MHYVQDIDIYRAAQQTINQHGGRALIVAMEKIELFRGRHDAGGMDVWRRIADKIEWLQMSGELTAEVTH